MQLTAGLHGVVMASVVGATLLFLVTVFQHMPMNAMAAIIIMGVVGLLDFGRALFYFKVRAHLQMLLFKFNQSYRCVWRLFTLRMVCIALPVGRCVMSSFGKVATRDACR